MLIDLAKQVEQELAEIQNAPVVPSAGLLQRCYFCGSVTHGGSEVRGPVAQDGSFQTKFKGVCCGG